jgi:hypothetical protein
LCGSEIAVWLAAISNKATLSEDGSKVSDWVVFPDEERQVDANVIWEPTANVADSLATKLEKRV